MRLHIITSYFDSDVWKSLQKAIFTSSGLFYCSSCQENTSFLFSPSSRFDEHFTMFLNARAPYWRSTFELASVTIAAKWLRIE